ncbi:nuclear transport factor 2 family protein [Fulvivirga sedimenti]|jgi:ketosteroid isomerase-like protein|uniref:Nuclear transport factor 2 family protein n=1 Tax=Fulvivirga sedimenti TaxID=2879465 RepID=A0A9X1HT37_9BACT|nr:nuclear transport factor 2 family protein [Fulvivirga sedimenti]MCA6075588.1 nuclear transport factor 2 family protein [Fulvivirga sedimenti]MCA6076765.1 nuclear transport factor 2 family protein [Fulvivirga sedimenti]MCA6077893.1 nuclear transport factor 2 family protein [Fulvivirga sedimenti]
MNHVEHLKGLYAAFGRGEVPTVLGAMDPQIQWNEAEGNPYAASGTLNGPDDVLNKLFMRLVEEWDDFTVTPKKFYGLGDTVVVEGRYTGTYKETGKSQDSPFCHVWNYENGKIKTFQQYTNTAALQEVMGVAV